MCVICALKDICVNEVCKKYHELFMLKTQLSYQIEQELKPEVISFFFMF